MLECLDNYDWKEVFKYARPHVCEAGHTHGPEQVIVEQTVNDSNIDESIPAVDREDVAEVFAMVDGVNDESDWVGVFKLKDGRYLSIRAGCDYTGWG